MRFLPSCEQTLRALARYPGAHGVRLARRIAHLSGRDRPDRAHPGRVHAARPCSPARASPSSPPTAPTPGAPASPRNCRGSRSPGCIRWARSTTSCSSSRIPKPQMLVVDARRLPRSRRRARGKGNRPEDGLHARPRRLRRRPAAGDRERRQRHARAASPAPTIIATLNYTGGTTGKSKGALRYHRELAGFASAILADFEIPGQRRAISRWRRSAMSPAPRCCRR